MSSGLARDTLFQRALNRVERIGNALPHPATLFLLLSGGVILLSWVLVALGVQVMHPVSGQPVQAMNLLSVAGLHRIILGLLPNFMNFAPLGPVLVCLLGLSVAEHSGLLGAMVRMVVGVAPRKLITLMVVFCGAMSHTAGDIGYVLLIPLSAALFHTMGRHPLAGLAAAFSGVSGGFAANLLLSPTDVILAGLTQEAARVIDPAYVVTPMANYFFLGSSVFLVTAVGTVITELVVEPRLGVYQGDVRPEPLAQLGAKERRGLAWAAGAIGIFALVVLAGLLPTNGFLQDPAKPGFVGSYFVRGLVFFIFVFGLVAGLAYGFAAGTLRRDADVYRGMQKNMEVVAGYVVVVFFIAQFVNLFNWANLGVILAVNGAALLKYLGLGPVPLLIGLILLTAVINLFLGSASAKWAMFAPIFVPMFMLLGYSPELTQVTYRVGDSLTNIITPLSSNFPLVLMFAQRYMPKAGIGTMTATMLPYSLANLVCWTLFLAVWMLAGWPLGPGAQLFLGTR
ncbi:MAG: AbgT family transporter [Opitutaceae bacterium]|nr:AbgT family transporter [Opitutaceae bacterium]